MARIRTIKPEFWVSEQIGNLCRDARLLFIGLWSFCDDRGVHPAKLKTLKAEVFPMDEVAPSEISHWIQELISAGLIAEFEEDGNLYWYVVKWSKHQRIDRPSNKHPPPPCEDSQSPRRALDECSTSDRCGIGELLSSAHRVLDPGVEGKREEMEELSVPPSVPAADPPGFADFWAAWPMTARKVDRKKCVAKWKAAKLAQHLPLMLEHIEAMKPTQDWARGYEPAPLTYLNGERWNDGLPSCTDSLPTKAIPQRLKNPLHADEQLA